MKEFAIKENHLFVKAYTKGARFAAPNVCVYVLRDYKAAKLKKENPRKQYLNRIGFTATTKPVMLLCATAVSGSCGQLTVAFCRREDSEQVILS